jgi:endonuclease/exonuclease/phosphatase family metal-dependent hydrolase
VVGFLVAPMIDDGAPELPPQALVVAQTVPVRAVDPPRLPRPLVPTAAQAGSATAGVAPVRLKQVPVGVASMNMFRALPSSAAAADARRLTRDPRVDVVGWQEAEAFGSVLRALPGWSTKTFADGDGPSELAVSWRSSMFRLVSAREQRAIPGVPARAGAYPFGHRSVAVVTLEHRSTGRRFTVVDVHLPPGIEDLGRPGRWRANLNAGQARVQLHDLARVWGQTRARWVVGTGDFNFDAAADARQRLVAAPRRALGRVAVSSYEALGSGSLRPTYPSNGRHIDYVWVDREAYREGWMRFVAQAVVGGLHSDHNALVTRLVLS